MAPIKELGGGGEERKESFLPSLPPPPTFIFLALVSFLARPKPRIPFLGLSLLRNQTETLATQAITCVTCSCSVELRFNNSLT